MEEDKREFLEGVYPYFKILEKLNCNLQELISTNVNNEPYKNEELFYLIASDLIRLFPVKVPWKEGERDYANANIDEKCGILLLNKHIPFLKAEYKKILNDGECKKAFAMILIIRNKYIHEPHNIHHVLMVGSNTSCSMSVNYKDELLPISTIWLTNIVYELNLVFEKIKQEYINQISTCDEKYKSYPCYKNICSIDLMAYNKKYTRMPWGYINVLSENVEYDWEWK